jgi:hypothetical protein
MDAIGFNNRERTKSLGSEPADSMTKRELMATEAMAALIQSMKISDSDSPAEVAELAIKMADALIEGLNK